MLTLINPLLDRVSDYRTCPEIPGHPIKLHIVNNMTTIWLESLNCILNGLQRILAWITSSFIFVNRQCCHEKGDNPYQPLGGSNTRIKSATIEMRVDWIAKMVHCTKTASQSASNKLSGTWCTEPVRGFGAAVVPYHKNVLIHSYLTHTRHWN